MSGPWSFELWRVLAITLAAVVLGLTTGYLLLFAFLATSLYLGMHLFQVYRLERWLRKREELDPPDARGVWGEVYHYFYQLQQRNQERKRRLQRLLTRFQESAAALPDGTVALTANDEIEWLNEAAEKLLGLRSKKDVGQVITNLIRHPPFTTYIRTGRYDEPIEIPSPSDENVRLQVRIVPYGKDECLLIARDVTDLHRLEQIRRDFVANVSHELRTPLTVIAGYLEAMQDGKDSEWSDSVRAMRQQATRMQHIVHDLLFLARLESSEGTAIEGRPVAVPAVIAATLEETRQLNAGKHEVKSQVDTGLWLAGRESELRSAFSNIVFNAVRYTPAGGNIRVRWYADDAGAHFEVADTGPGIAEHHIVRLTERFYRVDVARSRELGGTGLGLAIVKHVLNRHGAALRIESQLGHGSRFICDFPKSLVVPRADQAARA